MTVSNWRNHFFFWKSMEWNVEGVYGQWWLLHILHCCTVSMTCPSLNIPPRKFNTCDINDLIHHNLLHGIYFRNKIPIVQYNYYTCNEQIAFSSINILIAINCSFLFCSFFIYLLIYLLVFCIAGGTWRFCMATSHFLLTAKKPTGPGWSSVATAGTSMG